MKWMDNIKTWINGLFDKTVGLISKFTKERLTEEQVLGDLNIDIEKLYEDPEVAIEIQEKYMACMRQIDLMKKSYRETVDQVAIIQRIEMLPKKNKVELENLCQVYSETMVKKGQFRERIKYSEEMVKQSEYLEQYEDSIEKIINMMEEHEESQRLVKQDLAYLEAEKSDLTYQSDRLNKAYRFIKSSFVIVALMTALAAFVLTLLYFVYQRPILLPAMISMIGIIAASVWVYVFRRYLKFEIAKNQKLMKRAVSLLNKTKIKYINNQKVLDFQGQKYKVDSSEMLRMKWNNLNSKKQAEKQYSNINKSITATMTDIEDLVRKFGIEDQGLVLDNTEYFSTKKGRKVLLDKLTNKKNDLKSELTHTEKESQMLNLMLTSYRSHKAGQAED